VSDSWDAELLQWDFLHEKSPTLDAEDAERTLTIKDITDVQAAVFQMQEFENILGSNGTHKWKLL
jgi:hypothetical protein